MKAPKNILVFGHIPIWFGGKQKSGLSNVMYLLASHMANYSSGIKVSFAATDVFVEHYCDKKLNIFGWNKKILLNYILRQVITSIRIFISSYRLHLKYNVLTLFNLFLKRIFLKKIISECNPDIIHLHGANSYYYLDIIPSNVKIIVTIHHALANDSSVKNKHIYSKMEAGISKSDRINAIVFITNQVKDDFIGLYGPIMPKTSVILNAYERNMFYYINREDSLDKKIALCTIGTIGERKGQLRVIEALKSYNSKFKYICIGGGSKEKIEELHNTSTKYNVSFEYKGVIATKEIRNELASIDYMILPSVKEGFGLPFVESIACGVPVISPQHIPLVSEGILNNTNTVLIKNESVAAIESCLTNLHLYNFNRKKVSQSLPDLDWKNIANEYQKLIFSFY